MSSSETAIKITGLSKCFEIYNSPRDRLKQFILPRLQSIFGKNISQYFKEFWALKDITFEVKKGETIGIIGRNGSGKSTLLQIICGTLTPTHGTVETRGRIAALLELGSGFNPEFTGRENVYMNASVLGLTKLEIDTRFNQITTFADIGDFIEQPVKTYSSGMMLRLAFAVIAHVDADILVIDEALAVGDAIFTQKCMSFIRDFQKRGTLLFVSHDMGAVLSLCKKAVWLGGGLLLKSGSTKEVAEAYLKHTLQATYGEEISLNTTGAENTVDKNKSLQFAAEDELPPVIDYQAKIEIKDNLNQADGWKSESAAIIAIKVERLDGGDSTILLGGEIIRVTVRAKSYQLIAKPILGFIVRNRLGQDLFGENTLQFTDGNPSPISAGQEFVGEFVFRLPMLPNGEYAIMASVAEGDRYENIQFHYLHNAVILNVSSSRVRYGLVGVKFEEVSLKGVV